MKRIISILTSILFCANSFSQDRQRIDSLNKILLTSANDTVKATAIQQLCDEFIYTKPDSCLYYAGKGFALINNPSTKKQFESSGNTDLQDFEIILYRVSAVALSEQRSDSLAVSMGVRALQLLEKSKNTGGLSRVLGALGEIYQNIGEPAVALAYHRRMLTVTEYEYARQIAIASIGGCFYDLKQYDSALFYLHKIDPQFETGNNKPWPYPDNYLGNTYNKKGDYLKAISFYQSAVRKSIQSQSTQDLSQAYMGLASSFKAIGKIDSGLVFANMSLQIAEKYTFPGLSLDASNLLSSLYESKGSIDSAFKYQKISNTLRDTLFNKEKIQQVQNFTFVEKLRQKDLDQEKTAYQNKVKLYALLAGLSSMILFAVFLIRNNRQKQKANVILEETLSTLKSTQSQLIQSEKMASLGELTAGIAHEIQNPLNFVNNFSEVNKELLVEMKDEIKKGNMDEVNAIADDVIDNEEKIIHHGKRADAIVKSMLQHSQTSTRQKEPTDINKLADEYFRLFYHGLLAKDKSFNALMKTDFDESIGNIDIIPQDIGKVLLNLYNNAFYAVSEKQKVESVKQNAYEPSLLISTKKTNNHIEIKVGDNGNGIPQKIIDKIFQPFFTTKPTGQGTGLGLSLSYDIIKAHGGELKVDTREGEGSEFTIKLPIT
jgi:two-component system NtrC family sensor kinase